MKIGIIGTRGIPNNYGGFEQFAEYVGPALIDRGHDVYVYNSSLHPYTASSWKGVKLIKKFDPENKTGAFGQFIYDLNCILDSRKREYDIILQLGYTSSSIWSFLFPKKAKSSLKPIAVLSINSTNGKLERCFLTNRCIA